MSNPSLSNLQALREELSSAELDQGHLFTGWPEAIEECNDKQVALLTELYVFAKDYHGGVTQYIRNAKRLLDAESGESELCALRMPRLLYHAPSPYYRSDALEALETAAMAVLPRTVFVLVAGGLGERLGYSGIKVGLPVETATQTCYLQHYLAWARQVGGDAVPFVIMTSDDTHARTCALLAQLHVDAAAMPNLRLLKQETVFCLTDSAAHLALAADGSLLRKPHGHGDVHGLLWRAMTDIAEGAKHSEDSAHASSSLSSQQQQQRRHPLVDAWLDAGYEYICFLQDTNAPATLTIPLTLAVSKREQLTMNFTCVPRLPKEAVGLLCDVKTSDKDNGGDVAAAAAAAAAAAETDDCSGWVTKNVEYNIFELVAPRLTREGGDVAAANSDYSPFPGSINTLVCALAPYVARLRATHGAVPEFINPKYTDDTRRAFKKPARIESLMQDVAELFANTDDSSSNSNSSAAKSAPAMYRVGGTVFDRFTYQPVKNSLTEATAKVQQGINAYCPTTGEADYYELMRRRLVAVGVPLSYAADEAQVSVNAHIRAHIFPIVTLDAVALGSGTLQHLAHTFPRPGEVHVSAESTLIIEGHVIVESLRLHGALRLCGPSSRTSPPLVVRDVDVNNAPWRVRPTTSDDAEEVDRIRGFVLEKTPLHVIGGNSDKYNGVAKSDGNKL